MTHYPLVALVDDDQGVRQSLASLVRALGYHAAVFDSAEACFASLPTRVPDAIITDMQMQKASGLDLMRWLSERGTNIPTIVFTGFPSTENRDDCLALGAIAYLAKPADAATIATLLERVLGPAN